MFKFLRFFDRSRFVTPAMTPVEKFPDAPKGWFQLVEPQDEELYGIAGTMVPNMYVKFICHKKDGWFYAVSFHQHTKPKSFLELASTTICPEWVEGGPYEPTRDGELDKKLNCLEAAHNKKIEDDKSALKKKLLRDAKKIKCGGSK